MITFDEPLPFQEALDKIEGKVPLPTSLSTREMQLHTSAELRDGAFFSSRTTNAHIVQDFRNSCKRILAGTTNEATERAALKKLLASISYQPEEGKEGTLEDLSSNARLNLMLNTNVSMARGFGQWLQGNQEGALAAFPAQELIRVSRRVIPRLWIRIWDETAASLGQETSATDAAGTGRMVALKNDPIWTAISDFGVPWPPFKFNSGMGVEDVSYEEAVELGVMNANDDPLQPAKLGLNEGLSTSIYDLDEDLSDVLLKSLGGSVNLVDGVLHLKNEASELRGRGESLLRFMEGSLWN